tara:strand:- start:57 stop:686 length:630 start_codon:yes stop_codon:yes gene_type:complete
MSLPHEQSANSGVTPVQSAPLQDGASSQRQSAVLYRQNQVAKQSSMNTSLSGGKKKKRRYRGGSGNAVVPSFNPPGPSVSPVDATSNSKQSNFTSLQAGADASCDKCIGDASNTPTCQSAACNPQAGGKRLQKGGSCGSCGIQMGGSGCGNGGLIPNGQTWGCMSGGKRRYRKSRKVRKSKKSKKSRKGKKSKKVKKSKKAKKSRKSRK